MDGRQSLAVNAGERLRDVSDLCALVVHEPDRLDSMNRNCKLVARSTGCVCIR